MNKLLSILAGMACLQLQAGEAVPIEKDGLQKVATWHGHEVKMDRQINDTHEYKLAAFRAESRKLKASKSTFFLVKQMASDLRDVELRMSLNESQRIATLVRHASYLDELMREAIKQVEKGSLKVEESKAVSKWRDIAYGDLRQAKESRK